MRVPGAGEEAVDSGDEKELVVHDQHRAACDADRQSVFDAGAKAKPDRGGPVVGEAAFDASAEDGPPRSSGYARSEVEQQAVLVCSFRIAREALITIGGGDGEAGADAKGDAALKKVLEEIGGSVIEEFVDFELERSVLRAVEEDCLVEPEAYLLLAFGILGWLLLRFAGKGKRKRAQQGKGEEDAPV